MNAENRLDEAIKQLRIARSELGLTPDLDAKLAEAEINVRGVKHRIDDPHSLQTRDGDLVYGEWEDDK